MTSEASTSLEHALTEVLHERNGRSCQHAEDVAQCWDEAGEFVSHPAMRPFATARDDAPKLRKALERLLIAQFEYECACHPGPRAAEEPFATATARLAGCRIAYDSAATRAARLWEALADIHAHLSLVPMASEDDDEPSESWVLDPAAVERLRALRGESAHIVTVEQATEQATTAISAGQAAAPVPDWEETRQALRDIEEGRAVPLPERAAAPSEASTSLCSGCGKTEAVHHDPEAQCSVWRPEYEVSTSLEAALAQALRAHGDSTQVLYHGPRCNPSQGTCACFTELVALVAAHPAMQPFQRSRR